MQINWNNIRAIDGQREGFEELVCQLARQEKINEQKSFIRVGKPDSGKECFWELSGGGLHLWQAKYFLNSLSSSQWLQVDESVKRAIDNHPKLEKYYVAIPVDRPDGKGKGKSMLQKWQEYVTSWKKYALAKKMNVSFEYWGKYELENRLKLSTNEGLVYYFFNETEVTDSWLTAKNQESICALGGRYTPELNFKLPFVDFLNGFNRNQNFITQINGYYEDVLEKYQRTYHNKKKDELKEPISNLLKAVTTFKAFYESLIFSGIHTIPFEAIQDKLEEVEDAVQTIENQYNAWRDEHEKNKKEGGERVDYHFRLFHNELHDIQTLRSAIHQFSRFINSEVCALANNPYMVLVGAAGIGKSHILADIVSERNDKNLNSLLLLGENFSSNEMPWTQILRNQLRFNGSEDVFLGALNAKAESQESRIIIIIDALNEGNGRRVWPRKLSSFIRSFQNYPWLGLIVSVRDSFEDLIASDSEIDLSLVTKLYHPGFECLEYEASTHFFTHYGITPPGSPLLHPEFQNPLFLKLFCEGLQKKRLKEIPSGYQGISVIIENYISGVDLKLAQPDQLDYDEKLTLLKRAVNAILTEMAEKEVDHLPYSEAEKIVSNVFKGKCGNPDNQYLRRLISEGVLNENLYWKNSEYYDGVHFAYQRFQDHLFISALLDKYLDATNPSISFESGKLRNLLENNLESGYDQNFIEALSIQVPERVGKELHEVASFAAPFYGTARAFIDGLLWRRLDTIGESARDYVNQVILADDDLFYQFLDTTIALGTKPDFYFNADRLHNYLCKQSLPNRDNWWTTWLQYKYGENYGYNSISRLINWAWSDHSKAQVSDESIKLASIMLGWFLTSSNRYLRDAATKAMISILQNRIPVLIKVLKQFAEVNDPYVYERLYCVAYGCALRTVDHKALVPLSEYIYKAVFDTELVYPHILLRDYAKGVIEYTLHLGLKPNVEAKRTRPPYNSFLPDRFPTVQEIDEKYGPKGKEGNYGGDQWGATAILNSMTTEYGRGMSRYGDFGRYIFQSILSSWDVDYNALSNYAVQRIFELGYDPKLFTDFDSKQGSGRSVGHLERIGKKYQWMVFYEILAKVSDNCKFFRHGSYRWSEQKSYGKYKGSWEPNVRDIDPTVLIQEVQNENYLESNEFPWWIQSKYENWGGNPNQWIRRSDDFPSLETLLTVTDVKGVEWLNLNILVDWREPRKVGESLYDINRKRIYYDISTWLVRPKALGQILKLSINDIPWQDWYPRVSNRGEVFSREFYWSPAASYFRKEPYFNGDALPIELLDKKLNRLAWAYDTAVNYRWEDQYDCSKFDTIDYYKPSAKLALGLRPSNQEGEYVNDQNELVCFDPSVYQKGPSCLLIRKDHALKVLKKLRFRLIWIVNGEKQILGERDSSLPRMDHIVRGIYYLTPQGKVLGSVNNYLK